jgi:hypothetical protein
MVWYVGIVAVLNLGLGYVLALYMSRGRRQPVGLSDEAFDHEGL